MALQKDFTEERFNALISNAYLKLCYVHWSDVDKRMLATVSVWASATAEVEGKEALSLTEIDVTHLFPTLQADIYEDIKVLPEFDGSADV